MRILVCSPAFLPRVGGLELITADLADEHHPDDVDRFLRGHPETAAELAADAEPVEHRGDLGPATVDHDGLEPRGAEEDDVLGESPLELVVDHGVSAVLDDDDRAREAAEPWQGLDQDACLLLRTQVSHVEYALFSWT